MKHGIIAIFCLLTLPLANTALAQNQRVDLTPKQIQLHNDAVKKLTQSPPDAKAALVLVNKAMAAGPGTALLYLTKARSLQFLDQCEKSKIALSRIKSAPRINGMKESVIDSRVSLYNSDMALRCSGYLTIQCSNPATQIQIDGKSHYCSAPKKLQPGNHKVLATLGKQTKSFDIAIKGEQTLKIPVFFAATKDKTVKPKETQTGSYVPTIIAGSTTLILSGVMWGLVANQVGNHSDAVDRYYDNRSRELNQERLDDIDEEKSKAHNLIIGASIVSAVGVASTVVVYLLTGPKEVNTPQQTNAFNAWVAPDAAGVTWTLDF